MNNQFKLFLFIIALVGGFAYIQSKYHIFDVKLQNNQQTNQSTEDSSDESVKSSESTEDKYVDIVTGANKYVTVNVEVADTDVTRRAGLSYRKYLGDYNGMLFVYDASVNNPYSMQNMLMSLDIIFVDSQYFIVDIKTNQMPCTPLYCPNISSVSSYQYVLEVNAGFCEKNNIAKGGSLVLHLGSE
jgi:uncharacterized membrane protein (UPF0127 family)